MSGAIDMQASNDLMTVFSDTVSAGFDALQGPVNGVFGLMITLVVALTGVQWALSSQREVLAAGFGKVLLIGLFAYLINDWQALAETVQAGFVDLGLAAGGGSLSRADFLNPGAVLEQGWDIVRALGETPAPVANPLDVAGNLVDALILGLAMIGILLAFAVLAIQIVVTLLEFKIVTLGGFVLLPFGIWSRSAFLAERPLGYVVSSGLKVLALAIVVSGARTVFDQLQPSANPDLYEALAILVAALLLAMLAIFVPNLASALVTGGPALGAGAALTGALAVGGTAGLAAGGLAGAGRAATGAAARLSGASRAAAGAGSGRPTGSPPSGGQPSRPSGGLGGSPGLGPGGGGAPGLSRSPPSFGGPAPSGTGRSEPAGAAAERALSTGAAPNAAPASAAPGSAVPAGTSPGAASGPVPRPASEATAAPAPGAASGGASTPSFAGGPARAPGRIDAEAEQARGDFQRGVAQAGRAGSGQASTGAPRADRSAAFQTYFAANAGRALFPGSETSGSLSPPLSREDR